MGEVPSFEGGGEPVIIHRTPLDGATAAPRASTSDASCRAAQDEGSNGGGSGLLGAPKRPRSARPAASARAPPRAATGDVVGEKKRPRISPHDGVSLPSDDGELSLEGGDEGSNGLSGALDEGGDTAMAEAAPRDAARGQLLASKKATLPVRIRVRAPSAASTPPPLSGSAAAPSSAPVAKRPRTGDAAAAATQRKPAAGGGSVIAKHPLSAASTGPPLPPVVAASAPPKQLAASISLYLADGGWIKPEYVADYIALMRDTQGLGQRVVLLGALGPPLAGEGVSARAASIAALTARGGLPVLHDWLAAATAERQWVFASKICAVLRGLPISVPLLTESGIGKVARRLVKSTAAAAAAGDAAVAPARREVVALMEHWERTIDELQGGSAAAPAASASIKAATATAAPVGAEAR